MKNNKIKPKYIYMAAIAFLTVACCVLFVFVVFRNTVIKEGLDTLFRILKPFIIGAVLAYVLRPVCNFFEIHLFHLFRINKKREKLGNLLKSVSVFLSLVVALLIVYILIALIVPQLMVSIISITQRIPSYIRMVTDWGEEIFAENQVAINWVSTISEDIFEKLQSWARTDLLPQLANMVGGVSVGVKNLFAFLLNVLIGIIVSIYLLKSRKKLGAQSELLLYSLFRKKWADKIYEEIKFADKMFSGFISGKLLDSAIIGCICFVGVSIMDAPYAMLVSVIVGVTNIIPFFGPYIGAVPSVFLILTANPLKALYFLIFIIVLQQIDGNIIGPKILGDSTGLSGFWVLFSITLFGGLFGFAGMLIGVPVFAVIYDIVKQLIHYGLVRHENMDVLEKYEKNYQVQKPCKVQIECEPREMETILEPSELKEDHEGMTEEK